MVILETYKNENVSGVNENRALPYKVQHWTMVVAEYHFDC